MEDLHAGGFSVTWQMMVRLYVIVHPGYTGNLNLVFISRALIFPALPPAPLRKD
ncbi:MAG: hypothetical protein ABW007_24185 [Chitinophagaceae bacterium]